MSADVVMQYLLGLERRIQALEVALRSGAAPLPTPPTSGSDVHDAVSRALGRALTSEEHAGVAGLVAEYGASTVLAVLGRCRPGQVRGLGYLRTSLAHEPRAHVPVPVMAVSADRPIEMPTEVPRGRVW
jgi:hypothetical protein